MARELDLVFLWHMHQPDYRAPLPGDVELPWTYLHAMKDYTDMAAHLERHPEVRCVVNFVPVLLEQLEDYATQITQRELRDPLLRLLAEPDPAGLTVEHKRRAIDACFRTNHDRTVAPFPPYRRLHALHDAAQAQGESALAWLSGQYFADLVTWYHLAWTGEAERRRNPLIAALMSKGEGYTLDERLALLDAIGSMVGGVVPRYRALAERGQIELSTSPHAHPIAPLLIAFDSALEAMPGAPMPAAHHYPGGRQRLRRHVEAALHSHGERFGASPAGLWPAEGAVSAAALGLFADCSVQWTASSEAVLANTLKAAGHAWHRQQDLYRLWRDGSGLFVCFRDERLSDLIGFEYSRWHGQDAARHFVSQLAEIRDQAPADATPLVCVVLDGENAWEYYPYNAWYFFEELYSLLATQDGVRTCTLADALARYQPGSRALPPLVAGSWVYGTLSTWIGEPDKNHAWDLLVSAKQSYDLLAEQLAQDPARAARAESLLATLEGSDWFWWLGDYNPREAVASFESLFRRNLRALYDTLGLPVPVQLSQPLSRGGNGAAEAGGTMRRAAPE